MMVTLHPQGCVQPAACLLDKVLLETVPPLVHNGRGYTVAMVIILPRILSGSSQTNALSATLLVGMVSSLSRA